MNPQDGRQTCSLIHQRWEVRSFRSSLQPTQPQMHRNRLPMRTVLFCVDWKIENSVSYQISVGKSIKSNPVCTKRGWQIITSIPCFTLSATHASRRSGATASVFITATRNPCRVSRHLGPVRRLHRQFHQLHRHRRAHRPFEQLAHTLTVPMVEPPQGVVIGMVPAGQPQVWYLVPAGRPQLAAGAHVGHETVQPHAQQGAGRCRLPLVLALSFTAGSPSTTIRQCVSGLAK